MKMHLNISDVGVNTELCQKIWETAAHLLAEKGIEITFPRLADDLHKCSGISVLNGRAFIDKELFANFYPSPLTLMKQNKVTSQDFAADDPVKIAATLTKEAEPIKIVSGAYSMQVIDWRTGESRGATRADLRESIRVVEHFNNGGVYCVTPQDVPPVMQDIAIFHECFKSGRKVRGQYYSSNVQAPFIEKMCEIMNEEFNLILGVVSPLSMSGDNLQGIYDSIDRGKYHKVRLVGYGMPGIGSPAQLGASKALVMAENYGAEILLKSAIPCIEVLASAHAGHATDFINCCTALGAPQAYTYAQVNALLDAGMRGIDPKKEGIMPGGMLFTGSCQIDEQTAAEKSAQALLYALLGAKTFAGAGNLCVDDVFSLEQFIIDREIVFNALKTIECANASEQLAQLDNFVAEFDDILAGHDTFLSLLSTVDIMRAIFRPSHFFEHMKFRTWENHNMPNLRERAKKLIADALNENSYQLDQDRSEALAEIYRTAEKKLV
jgi:trimethylamine:corrinoid methyltransferase-like protein